VKFVWQGWLKEAAVSARLGRVATRRILMRQLGLLVAIVAVLLVSGCFGPHAQDYPQTAMDPTTEYGAKQQRLWELLLWAMIVVGVLVEGALVYTIFRYRGRPGQPRPRQIHGNTPLEITWTIIPVVLLVIVGVPTVQTIFDIGGDGPENAIKVEVIGHQWWWEFYYPELGIITANELVFPVNNVMRLDMKSDDVIHSFWLPRIGGKRDVNPNHPNHLWFDTPAEPGEYLGQCAEFCGTSHAYMRVRGYAVSEADWNGWVQRQRQPALEPTAANAQRGKELFQQRCAACHTIVGVSSPAGTNPQDLLNQHTNRIGPNLTHVGSRTTIASALFPNTTDDLKAWIANAPGRKPGVKMPQLGGTDEELTALAAYLQSLK
jgi:cytochrome c oxidase subunit 2